MSDSRRYDEQEIAEILRLATETDDAGADEAARSPAAARAGLTLAQIQEIGGEVGIAPARIEHAARALEPSLSDVAPPVRFLGAPRSVSRTVALDRPLTDEEWMRLVALLRETFGARGSVEAIGALRTWYNGNLQVHAEPWEGGHRVRMSTFKGNVTELTIMGSVFLFMAILTGLLIYFKKGMDVGLLMSAMFGALGIGVIGTTRLALPSWANKRAAQMEEIAERIPRLLDEPGDVS